ncbi:MAG: hypothetical protein M1812_008249 [Candelaria pacifica]|nr:MAG: hypothetical protein M1812_008249 [Candelaria pacifica]
METQTYCSASSLQFAKRRIQNPPDEITYEHHVGSWACTMLSLVFNEPFWIITPEKRDQYSNKRPDLVVEKLDNTTMESRHYLFMELKSSKGDRFEDALAQVVEEIAETMEETIEAYVVVQRGTKIGFFEYHNDQSNLDEEGIPHFKGCVSLTQDYLIEGRNSTVSSHWPEDLELLYHDHNRLRKTTDTRTDAKEYEQACVFDLDKHEQAISFLFSHVKNKEPRSSV